MKSQLEQFVLCLKANTSEDARVKHRSNALMFYLNGDFSNDSILRQIKIAFAYNFSIKLNFRQDYWAH